MARFVEVKAAAPVLDAAFRDARTTYAPARGLLACNGHRQLQIESVLNVFDVVDRMQPDPVIIRVVHAPDESPQLLEHVRPTAPAPGPASAPPAMRASGAGT